MLLVEGFVCWLIDCRRFVPGNSFEIYIVWNNIVAYVHESMVEDLCLM